MDVEGAWIIDLRRDVSCMMSAASSAPNVSTAPSRPLRGPFHTSSLASLLGQNKVILNPRAQLVFSVVCFRTAPMSRSRRLT